MSLEHKDAGVRFDPDNYVFIEYNPTAPTAKVTIIQNGEVIEPSEDYITIEQLTNILGDYVTNSDLNTTLSDYVTDSDLNTALDDYVTDTSLASTLNDYVSDSELTTTLSDYVTDSDLNTALDDYVTDASLISTLNDYVTDTELQSEIQDFAKLKRVEHTYSGTYTIPSTGYVSLGTAPSPIGSNIIASVLIASWGSNNGGVTPALASGNQVYLIGNANNSITDFTLRFLYFV